MFLTLLHFGVKLSPGSQLSADKFLHVTRRQGLWLEWRNLASHSIQYRNSYLLCCKQVNNRCNVTMNSILPSVESQLDKYCIVLCIVTLARGAPHRSDVAPWLN